MTLEDKEQFAQRMRAEGYAIELLETLYENYKNHYPPDALMAIDEFAEGLQKHGVRVDTVHDGTRFAVGIHLKDHVVGGGNRPRN